MGDSSDSLDGIDWDEQEQLAIDSLKGATKESLSNKEAFKSSHPMRDFVGPHGFHRSKRKDPCNDVIKRGPVGNFGSPSKRHCQGGGGRHGQTMHSPGGRKYGTSPTKEKSGVKWAVNNLPPPAIPFERCPGVYKECGGMLKLGEDGCRRFWYCLKYPSCKFRYHLEPQKNMPILSLEIVASRLLKVSAAGGAESAVHAHGGVLSVLKKAGLDLTKHESISLQHKLWLDSGLCSEEFGTDVAFFKLDEYDEIERVLNQHGRNLLLRSSSVMRSVLRYIRKPDAILSSQEEVESRWKKLPAGLVQSLMPFQTLGVRFGLERGGRCLLADEMGLGKTLQAIALAVCYQDEWPLLIVTPASLRLVWAEELEKWLPSLRPSEIHVIEGKQHALRSDNCIPKITISSFEMVKRLSCEPCCKGASLKKKSKFYEECTGFNHCIVAKNFGVVIVDESHSLRATKSRDHDAAHTEACVSIVKHAKRSVLLSGTPSLSKPFELYRQVDALRPGILTADKNLFADRYCYRKLVSNFGRDGKHYDITGATHFHELHFLLTQIIMIRRLKKDVMSELPPKRRQVIRLPKPALHHWPTKANTKRTAQSDSDVEDFNEEQDIDSDSGSQEDDKMSPDRQTGIAKLPYAIAWLKDTIRFQDNGSDMASQSATLHDAEPPKILVFAHHRDVMDGLASEFEATLGSAGYVRIDGQSDPTDRMQAVNKFRNNPNVRLALLSITAAGVGLDFSAATVVIFVELPREVSFVKQAEDRAHRKGQEKAVNVYYLCAKGTTDDARWQHLGKSLDNTSVVHDGAMGGEETARSSWRRQTDALCNYAGAGLQIDSITEFPETDDTYESSTKPKDSDQNVERALHNPSFPLDLESFNSGGIPRTDKRVRRKNTQNTEDLFWFEASKNTSRVHIFGSKGGALPLVSMPLESLLHNNLSVIDKLKDFLKNGLVECSDKITGFLNPFGVIEIPKMFFRGSDHIDLMISTAQEFAQEWIELRSIFRSKLYGMVICPPLDSLIDKISSEFAKNYIDEGSTERYLNVENRKLPEGVILETFRIFFPGEINPREHKQPVSLNLKQMLCLHCLKPITDLCIPADELLRSQMYFFCSGVCEVSYGVKTSRSALRRELFQLERGVCQMCKLDCHALVKSLRSVKLGTRGWKSRRGQIIRSYSSKLAMRGYKKLFDRLVCHAIDGFAWNADHIVPVYKGGGQCGVDNLRTLCVACHADVTKQQVKDRKAERDSQKATGVASQVNLISNLKVPSSGIDTQSCAPEHCKKKPRVSKLKKLYGSRCEPHKHIPQRIDASKKGDDEQILNDAFSTDKAGLGQNLDSCGVEINSSNTPSMVKTGPKPATLCMNSHIDDTIVPSGSWPSDRGSQEDVAPHAQ